MALGPAVHRGGRRSSGSTGWISRRRSSASWSASSSWSYRLRCRGVREPAKASPRHRCRRPRSSSPASARPRRSGSPRSWASSPRRSTVRSRGTRSARSLGRRSSPSCVIGVFYAISSWALALAIGPGKITGRRGITPRRRARRSSSTSSAAYLGVALGRHHVDPLHHEPLRRHRSFHNAVAGTFCWARRRPPAVAPCERQRRTVGGSSRSRSCSSSSSVRHRGAG